MTTEKRLERAKADYNQAFSIWEYNGMPEANNLLNCTAIELIKTYKMFYPAAVGYKAHEGIVEITDKIYNFHCDMVFNGTEENLKKVNNAIESGQDVIRILDLIGRIGGEYIVFS